MGDESIQTLLQCYAKERPAEYVISEKFMRLTESKVFRKYKEKKRFNSFITEVSGH